MKYAHAQQNKEKGKMFKQVKIVVCPLCENVRYKGIWYAQDSKPAFLINKPSDTREIMRCPACEMKTEGLYEGILKIHNVPYGLKNKVQQAILRAAHNEIKKNPQHRLLEFEETVDGYMVTTTTSLAAQNIGMSLCNEFETYGVYSTCFKGKFNIYETSVVFV